MAAGTKEGAALHACVPFLQDEHEGLGIRVSDALILKP